jgi:hypothetical protein
MDEITTTQTLEQKWDLQNLNNGYIECDPGWNALLEQFLRELTPEQRSSDIHQIKEKFGTLRIYGTIEVEQIARKYETLSATTCEISGQPGTLHKNGGWLKTLSSIEAARLGYEPIQKVDPKAEHQTERS